MIAHNASRENIKRILGLVVAVLGLVTVPNAQAGHRAGHYGGVPAVQPAPMPWRHQVPAPAQRRPIVVAPPPYVLPPAPVYVPVPAPAQPEVDESPSIPARRQAPNVCDTLRC